MQDKVMLGAAVLDAVGRSCVLQSDGCTLQSQITLCKKTVYRQYMDCFLRPTN